jgi:hypothetical protein
VYAVILVFAGSVSEFFNSIISFAPLKKGANKSLPGTKRGT